jgi:hypothetical protein
LGVIVFLVWLVRKLLTKKIWSQESMNMDYNILR